MTSAGGSAPAVPAPAVQAMQAALAAEHAAVYGYPELGLVLTDGAQVQRARDLEAAHRLSRDGLLDELARRGASPVAAAAAYAPPSPLSSAAAAQRWAVRLEEDCAAAYRYLVAASVSAPAEPTVRRTSALASLTTSAQRATEWRLLVSPDAPTVAFPGS